MVAGGALYSPVPTTESSNVHESSPSVSPSISVLDIQIASDESEGRFEINLEQSENRPGMFRRMSSWFRSP